MPHDNQCRLIGTIKELLDKGLKLSSSLRSIFSPGLLDDQVARIDAAQDLIKQAPGSLARGTDFIQDFSFPDSNPSPLLFCSNSLLHPQARAPTASDADCSLASDHPLPSSHQSSTSSISILKEDPRFRTTLLEKVTQMAEGLLRPSEEAVAESKVKKKDMRDNVYASTCRRSLPEELEPQRNQPVEVALRAAQDYIASHLAKLEETLPGDLHRNGDSFFFLAIDQVAYFTELVPVLRRLWRESTPKCTWLILIDKESSIAHLAANHVLGSGLRLGDEEGKTSVPPFTYLPFDVHFAHRLESTQLWRQLLAGDLTFRHLIDMLRWFGRPLWDTVPYRQSIGIDEECYRPHLSNLVKKLLYGRHDSPRSWPAEGDTQSFHIVMAAVGQRLPLSYVGHQDARFISDRSKSDLSPTESHQVNSMMKARFEASQKFIRHQVAGHLRVISDVNRGDSYISATPSEPAVSLAVASEFRGKTSEAVTDCIQRWSDAVHVLARAHRSVGMMLGEEGEECVRLLVTIAADLVAADRVQRACTEKKLAVNSIDLFRAQCDPICLRDWLQTLFNTESKASWYGVHHHDQPRPGRDVLEWASDYYLNFTHFVKLGVTVVPDQADPKLLVEYWCRQAALYGVRNQHAWDLLIPIYRSTSSAPSLDDHFDPNQLSYVAIQVKNCHTAFTATDRFGPSYWYPETVPSSVNPTAGGAAASSQGQGPRLLDDCLEILFDLRGVSGIRLRDFTETRQPYKPENRRAPPDNTSDANQEEPSLLPRDDQGDAPMEEAAASPDEADQRRLRPNNCLNLVVGGTSASVLHVITYLDETARKELRSLFVFDDDDLEQNWKRITRECMSARGDAITKEFEEVTLALQSIGQTHLLEEGPRRPRGATSIPGSGCKGKKRAQPDGDGEVGTPDSDEPPGTG
ncbi:uncharacterized protein UTRI_04682 [Ustilago trichophora]|uniref:Uncharacterized protein n=1 Tax=Ustilago trichophora TaxID=86804 RepID=A0A5C3EE35_9BASI|nr:uncharacterized protein UTRI_04682 [Ustilago trichophora]